MKLQRIYFYWICPDTNAFEWFADLLKEMERQMIQADRREFADFNIYLTRGWDRTMVPCPPKNTSSTTAHRTSNYCIWFLNFWSRISNETKESHFGARRTSSFDPFFFWVGGGTQQPARIETWAGTVRPALTRTQLQRVRSTQFT